MGEKPQAHEPVEGYILQTEYRDMKKGVSHETKQQKIGSCPVCGLVPRGSNRFVRYHIRYSPPLVVLACSYCNMVERLLRLGVGVFDPVRAGAVAAFQMRFLYTLGASPVGERERGNL